MRATRADTAQAILFAVALHVILLVMVLFGMWWTRTHDTVSAAGSPVQADVVDANALSAAMRSALSRPVEKPSPPRPAEAAAPPPQPIPEPTPQEAPTPQQNQAQELDGRHRRRGDVGERGRVEHLLRLRDLFRHDGSR